MLSYLLDKFEKIKKDRSLFCSQLEEARKNNPENKCREITIYDFICKNTRK